MKLYETNSVALFQNKISFWFATGGAGFCLSRNLAEKTRKVLAILTPREEKILRMRFGIGEKTDHTLDEISREFDLTRERIRQIEARALQKLQHSACSRSLRVFIER